MHGPPHPSGVGHLLDARCVKNTVSGRWAEAGRKKEEEDRLQQEHQSAAITELTETEAEKMQQENVAEKSNESIPESVATPDAEEKKDDDQALEDK